MNQAARLRRTYEKTVKCLLRGLRVFVHFGVVREASDRDSCELHGAVGIRSVRGVQARELVRGNRFVRLERNRLLEPLASVAVAADGLQDEADGRSGFGGLRRVSGQRFEGGARAIEVASRRIDLREQRVAVE